ncbi:hypothetical protein B0A52_01331 [Exophiala mesophila]|uniref:Dimethylhistidine N-methyltransferase n=1 Tax=Exophiala mesophila TaxID=212818 RepID=A0A438NH42_EXOME|nr:hypothetical protein B0A52_01331 [Exophiala mesophila]
MATSQRPAVRFLDIRGDKSGQSLLSMLKESLDPPNKQPRSFPTLLLYNEKGLKIFEEITYLDEYYLTNAEIEALETHAREIATQIPRNSRLVELGSGNLRKINILLEAFEAAKKKVDYYALDLSFPELQRTFAELDTSRYQHVSFNALHGTYDDALTWLSNSSGTQSTCVMTMGSSLGNFSREDAAGFLTKIKSVLGPADIILVGLDACQDPQRVFEAYNDSQLVTERFYRNGLDHANSLLGYEVFRQEDWSVEGRYDEQLDRHHATYLARKDIKTKDYSFKRGERLPFEESFKYSEAQSDQLWHDSGLVQQMAFGNKSADYFIHLLSPAAIDFATTPAEYATNPIPSSDDWQKLWTAWDVVTRSMIPRDELLNKPIKLRNDLIFYLGHIPTFAGTQISISQRQQMASQRNRHPIGQFSSVGLILTSITQSFAMTTRVRSRITDSLESGQAVQDRRLGRGLWLAYEHEAMHLETFLYMLLQSDRIVPPPGTKRPDFRQIADEARANRVANKFHRIPAAEVTLGLDDPENHHGPDRYFGWDNERPSRTVSVAAFEAQSRPISNGDYAYYLEVTGNPSLPASWIARRSVLNGINGATSNGDVGGEVVSSEFLGDKALRTVWGPLPLKDALDWPVMASYDELAAYAKWANGRIPTLEEARSIYHHVESRKDTLEKVPSKLISAVNGHLSNEGVEETPPSKQSSGEAANGSLPPNPNELFVDLNNCPVGFKAWTPQPITHSSSLRGQADVGGLWEWTSTPLAPYDGFKAMDLYPGYTADFFDGKHNICLGGSWATIPRIAGRKTFVNWYQRNYPYVWCTARLVRDIAE